MNTKYYKVHFSREELKNRFAILEGMFPKAQRYRAMVIDDIYSVSMDKIMVSLDTMKLTQEIAGGPLRYEILLGEDFVPLHPQKYVLAHYTNTLDKEGAPDMIKANIYLSLALCIDVPNYDTIKVLLIASKKNIWGRSSIYGWKKDEVAYIW